MAPEEQALAESYAELNALRDAWRKRAQEPSREHRVAVTKAWQEAMEQDSSARRAASEMGGAA